MLHIPDITDTAMAEARESNPSQGYFTMGLDTLKVPVALFAENRRRLCDKLRAGDETRGAVVLLQVTIRVVNEPAFAKFHRTRRRQL